MLSSLRQTKNDAMNNAEDAAGGGSSGKLRVLHAPGGVVLEFAARELAAVLGRMLSEQLAVSSCKDVRGTRIVLSYGAAMPNPEDWSGDGFAIVPSRAGIVLCGADERSVLDAVYRLMR